MKKIFVIIKESLGGIIIALLLGFMLMMYEPLNMYAGSLNDFWFDIYSFFPILITQFIITFFILSLFFIIVNVISKKAYKIILVIAFIATLATYIQGNFLIYNLPGIDGSPINYDIYKTDKLISYLLWIVITVVFLIILYKIKFDKFNKLVKGISICIIVMLFVGSISLLTTPHLFDKKEVKVATYDNFNSISRDKNFLIFVIDQADSKTFDRELTEKWNKEEILKDFTYYPDTSSTYLWTLLSIPYIISGEYYENDTHFSNYFTHALDNAPLLRELEKNDYKLNIYEDEELLNYEGKKLDRFENIQSNVYINKKELIKQEIKYVLFKYLPYQLKWRSEIESLNINNTKNTKEKPLFSSLNYVVYDYLKNKSLNIVEDKYFHFVHIEGAHAPFRYDNEMNFAFGGKYEDSINASISMMDKYLKRIKDSNCFDNSVIIIISDHGYGDETIKRSNPILYIKGFNEKHDYQESDKKVSFENLNEAYKQLINGDTTNKLFENLDNRERRIMYCELYHTDHLKEMKQTGNAWDINTIVDTGREYIRKE